jgi:hypothetical protein
MYPANYVGWIHGWYTSPRDNILSIPEGSSDARGSIEAFFEVAEQQEGKAEARRSLPRSSEEKCHPLSRPLCDSFPLFE